MARSSRARDRRARTAVVAAALVASVVGAMPAGAVPNAAPNAVPAALPAAVPPGDQLDITPNWRTVPRHAIVKAVSGNGYVHETEDSDESFGGELSWTDFSTGQTVSLGYGSGNPAFAETGVGGRYAYVQRGAGIHYLRDLVAGTEQPLDLPRDASLRGLLGDTLLFQQYASENETQTTTGYYLRRVGDATGTKIPVTGFPEGANVHMARLVAGDDSAAVIRFSRTADAYDLTDLGVVDLRTGQMTVIAAPTSAGESILVAPVALSADRIAWVDRDRQVHIRERSALNGAERTFALPEGLSTARIGLVGDWVLAVGEASGTDAALQRRLVALSPDGLQAQTLLEKAEPELHQIVGGAGAAVVGGSSAADWFLLKVVPGKGGGAPVLEKLRRVEPLATAVQSLALGAGRLSTLEQDGQRGRGFFARTLPVGPMHTGQSEPVSVGSEERLENTTPLFDSGDGRTVHLARGFDGMEVVGRRSAKESTRAATGKNTGWLADASGRWAVFQSGRPSIPGNLVADGETLVVDLDAAPGAQPVVRRQAQTAAALRGDTLFAGTATVGQVSRTDLVTGKDLGTVATGADCAPTELQTAGRWLYWSCAGFSKQGVVDLQKGTKVALPKGSYNGGLLGDGFVVDQGSGSYLRLIDFHTGTAAAARTLVDSAPVQGARREAWAVDRFGGAVAYKDAENRIHAVWTSVTTSDLTATATNVPAAARATDGWKASWSLSKPASYWQLTLRRKVNGAVVRTYDGGETRGRIAVGWDGKDAAGRLVTNGTFTWTLTANTADGEGLDLSASGTVSVTGGRVVPWRDIAGNDAFGDLLVMDQAGLVSLYRGNGSGGLAARTNGTGGKLPNTALLVPVGDMTGDGCNDTYGRVGDELRGYRTGCGAIVSDSSAYTLLGRGWGQYDVLTSPGDVNGDGWKDLIARQTSTGDMYFYPGTEGTALGARVRIGTNWKLYKKIVGAGDLNGDGRGDLLGVDAAGVLWRYYGTANGGVTARVKVGGGWGVYSSLVGVGDITGDGRGELLARDTTGKLWRYTNLGNGGYAGRVMIGSGGWNGFKALY
ncbi:FG-GAP-like repeat-containing protein [Streptomyces sp. NPDC026092]|uniref:FG-GAP-like repeat-containing protein n=1 Tax=Streptomyces sp. NPDC026092 TaxID=3154797 RepID=UPI0033F9BE6C